MAQTSISFSQAYQAGITNAKISGFPSHTWPDDSHLVLNVQFIYLTPTTFYSLISPQSQHLVQPNVTLYVHCYY
mgnify:CR=1 FL=1